MICKECKSILKCVDTTSMKEEQVTYRRYKCKKCGETYYTEEYPMFDDEAKGQIYYIKNNNLCTHREKRN